MQDTAMLISSIGSLGIGLMWGWLLVLLRGQAAAQRPSWRVLLILFLATAALSGLIAWLADGLTVLLFGGTAVISFIVHLAWRHALAERRN